MLVIRLSRVNRLRRKNSNASRATLLAVDQDKGNDEGGVQHVLHVQYENTPTSHKGGFRSVRNVPGRGLNVRRPVLQHGPTFISRPQRAILASGPSPHPSDSILIPLPVSPGNLSRPCLALDNLLNSYLFSFCHRKIAIRSTRQNAVDGSRWSSRL